MEINFERLRIFLPIGTQDIVSKKCGITPVTVSRAWNNYQNGKVSEELKAVIFKATANTYLEFYDGEMRDIAEEMRRELAVK